MGGIVADTTIWVDVERERLTAAELEAAFPGEPIYLAPPILAELEYGLASPATDKQRARRETALAALMLRPCIPITAETGRIFGRLAAGLNHKGRPATHRVQDLWIASVALEYGLKVLTANRNDFDDIPGLTVLSPPSPRAKP
ncbi:MAG: type II toxin-antitoxin system VapC family toxin [Planctomycetes bacterium]|nr:type II toxin-antitoxin system VapC family toxin [Planctomycetota bacterium]